ncbi:hypothetical protein BT96DRAFT_987777 [Gymnopus androsaceus JB14]|uniref:Uncharacterized protein n=1 Tax=Gymnopus androsaceus JB14 TaxID=1447944 RepID=A0A6A4IBA5_9AGAR|nr:hypothetical protein BT96DRAFT_987777 [Gymnopus androsaceus JB14]
MVRLLRMAWDWRKRINWTILIALESVHRTDNSKYARSILEALSLALANIITLQVGLLSFISVSSLYDFWALFSVRRCFVDSDSSLPASTTYTDAGSGTPGTRHPSLNHRRKVPVSGREYISSIEYMLTYGNPTAVLNSVALGTLVILKERFEDATILSDYYGCLNFLLTLNVLT